MIGGIKLSNLLYRTYVCSGRRFCTVSTSFVSQREKLKKTKIHQRKQEVLNESLKNFENTFGNLEAFESKFEKFKDDPEDIEEYLREKEGPGKTINEYIKEIKYHLDQHNYKNALKALEVDMVNDKKPVITFVYKLLINYNAKLGNLEEAYRLYVRFKKRQGIVVGAMYTSLFNACANCRNSKLALEKADSIAENLRNNKHHSANISNYNAMLKAYGRHGDISRCLKIMDEVMEKRDKVRNDTYSFLFQACITDKNSGLRHALIIWRKMIQNRILPSLFSFNLLLRCVKDCSLGDTAAINSLIDEINEESKTFFKRKVIYKVINDETKRTVLKIPVESQSQEAVNVKNDNYMIESNNTIQTSQLLLESTDEIRPLQTEFRNLENQQSSVEINRSEGDSSPITENISSTDLSSESGFSSEELINPEVFDVSIRRTEIPNLLAKQISTGAVVRFDVMTEPHHRFLLLGGFEGFLKVMDEFHVKPDIKTFTLMLSVIPSTQEAEKSLISAMQKYKIKFDTQFFNILIKRRIFRFENSAVKSALEEMFSLDLKPDIITFGILAMSCANVDSAKNFLRTLNKYGYRPNIVILKTLLKNAIFARDLNYVHTILQTLKEEEIEPTAGFMANLSKFIQKEKQLRQKESENQLKKPEDNEEVLREFGNERNESK